MSFVTSITLICGLDEADILPDSSPTPIELIDQWIRARAAGVGLRLLNDHFGGPKAPEHRIAGGAFNHLDVEGFIAMVLGLDWEEPERVLLVVVQERIPPKTYRVGDKPDFP